MLFPAGVKRIRKSQKPGRISGFFIVIKGELAVAAAGRGLTITIRLPRCARLLICAAFVFLILVRALGFVAPGIVTVSHFVLSFKSFQKLTPHGVGFSPTSYAAKRSQIS